MRLKTLTISALPFALAACASGPRDVLHALPEATPLHRELFAAGVKRFDFDGWAGPEFPVWTYRPKGTSPDAPILFVFHGVQRDADNYMRQWIDLAEAHRIILIVPEYSRAAFPGVEAYSHGWFTEKDGTPRPREKWSFAAVEPIFAAVKQREGLSAPTYSIYGHSGGAQFVHRFILAGGGPNLARAVSANSGSYAATAFTVRWPFGLGGVPDGLWDPARTFALLVTILLGTADTDPDHKNLPRQPEAMAQGAHRLERGEAFYALARRTAANMSVSFNWNCGLVSGVGHDNAGMAGHAVSILFGTLKIETGGDCKIL